MHTINSLLRTDRRLQLILLTGLVVQLLTSVISVGFSHPDQHFSIIEFSSYQLGNDNAANHVFELESKIRPTLQVYLFSAFYKSCLFFGIRDAYLQLTFLRILTGLSMFLVFNLVAIHYFKNEQSKIIYSVLLILNFSWLFPYTRTLFNSEMMCSLLFFGTLALYDAKGQNRVSGPLLVLIGFLLCLSFYFRFQIGFCIAGFGLWLVFYAKTFKQLPALAAGFIAGIVINTYLDYHFYNEFVITPYRYFNTNIIQGKAAEFGTSSFLKYIGLLVAVITAPPLSLVLFYYGSKTFLHKYNHPVCIAVFLFIVGHCMIGHKEERFLYPVFSALPLVVGWSLPQLFNYYQRCKRWQAHFIKACLVLTLILNTVALMIFTFIPYAQTVHFGELLKKRFTNRTATINCQRRTPFETTSGLPMVFYRSSVPNLRLNKVQAVDSLRYVSGGREIFVATTFNDIKNNFSMMDSLGYKPVMYSSKALWKLNCFLLAHHKPTINDAWVLYKK